MKMASVALIELVAIMYEQNMMHHVLPANGEDDVQALTCTRSKDPDQVAPLPKFNFELPRTINITPIQSPFVHLFIHNPIQPAAVYQTHNYNPNARFASCTTCLFSPSDETAKGSNPNI